MTLPVPKVLIHNDNGRRDLLPLSLLAISLKRRGLRVQIAGRSTLRARIRRFRPDAVVLARGDSLPNPVVRRAAEVCSVYVMPSEGGRTTKETTLSVFLGRGYRNAETIPWVRRCFTWNENTTRWLIESGMLKPSQITVSGSPKLDIYRHMRANSSSSPDRPFTVGIAFSATSTSQYHGHEHFAMVYHDIVHEDYRFPVVPEGHHFEDIVWRDHAILRTMMHVIKRLGSTTNYRMVMRPNPLESLAEYRFLERKYESRFKLLYDEPLPVFLSKVDVLLTCWSTTGIEALLNGIPVISINGLIDQTRLFDHIARGPSGFDSFVGHYYRPESFQDLARLLALAAEKRLAPSPRDPEDTARMINDIYGWNAVSSKAACETIADTIAADLASDRSTASRSDWGRAIPMPYRLPPLLAEIGIILRDFARAARSGDFASYSAFYRSKDRAVSRLIRNAGCMSPARAPTGRVAAGS